MKIINKEEQKKIKGGISEGTVILISAAVIFILGIFTGYTNPKECNVK